MIKKAIPEKITKVHLTLTSAIVKQNSTYKDNETKTIRAKWIEWRVVYAMSMKERQGKFHTGQIGKQNPLNCLCETHSSFPSMASNFFLSSRRLGRETQTTYALSLPNFAGLDVLENLKSRTN